MLIINESQLLWGGKGESKKLQFIHINSKLCARTGQSLTENKSEKNKDCLKKKSQFVFCSLTLTQTNSHPLFIFLRETYDD